MMSAALDFNREGSAWPHRDKSQFIKAGHLTFHVQIMGDGDPLLLASRKLAWMMAGPLSQTDFIKRLQRTAAPLRPRHKRLAVKHRQFHILQSTGPSQQVKALKNKTDFFISDCCEMIFFRMG